MPLSLDVIAPRLIELAVEPTTGQLQVEVQITPDAAASLTRQLKVSGPEPALYSLLPSVKGKSGGGV